MGIISLLAQASDYYYSSPSTTTSVDPATAAAVAGGMFLFALIFIAIGYVVGAFLLSRIFKKAGVEQWKAWVPVYSNWVLLEMGDQPGYWAILAFIPIVGFVALVFQIIALYHIGLKLGKSGAFVLLAIFLPIVWAIWLAFDDSKWQGTTVATTTPQPPVTPPTPPTPIA